MQSEANVMTPPGDRTPVFHGSLARGILWVCLAAPVATVPVFSRNFFELAPAVMAQSIVGNALPCWAVPLAVYGVYRLVMRRWLAKASSKFGKGLLHAGVSAFAAVLAALVIRPAMVLFSNEAPEAIGFSASCVVMTWALLLPSLIIERHGDRAAAIERCLQAEREAALRAELEALRARVQPHFLFNALNTIAGLVREDPRLAEGTIERLASLLRYVMASSNQERVSLRRELETIEDYLEVQRARFGARLCYTLELDPGVEELQVPPVVLQPLVENAVLHGISAREEGVVVHVAARLRPPMLKLSVWDDGPRGGASRHDGTGTSLRDLRRRLEIIYGAAAWLHTGNERGGGFCAEIGIPLGPTSSSKGLSA